MIHGSLFSGIGGFDLAAEWMGWENKFHCEWNEFGQKVLKHYWPEAIGYGDITNTDFTIWRGKIDILSGGFPCQPYSTAGKRLGKEDDRHLWPEMLRAIREIQPGWVVGENVSGLVSWNGGLVFDEVQADLETEGYEVQPVLLPACAVNAPHRRDRIWFIAYSASHRRKRERSANEIKEGLQPRSEPTRIMERGFEGLGIRGATTNTTTKRMERDWTEREQITDTQIGSEIFRCNDRGNNWSGFPTQSPICSGDDGIPSELDGITFPKWRNESIKAAGNAIVPQVAYEIFKVINEINKTA